MIDDFFKQKKIKIHSNSVSLYKESTFMMKKNLFLFIFLNFFLVLSCKKAEPIAIWDTIFTLKSPHINEEGILEERFFEFKHSIDLEISAKKQENFTNFKYFSVILCAYTQEQVYIERHWEKYNIPLAELITDKSFIFNSADLIFNSEQGLDYQPLNNVKNLYRFVVILHQEAGTLTTTATDNSSYPGEFIKSFKKEGDVGLFIWGKFDLEEEEIEED